MACRVNNARRNGVVVSSGSMSFTFLYDSIARPGRFCQPSFSLDADSLKALVSQNLSDNDMSEIFLSAEDQAACVDASPPSTKLRAKLRQRLSDELSRRNCRAK